MPQLRTFADAESVASAMGGHLSQRQPVGQVHAAWAQQPDTLCGIALDELSEFGSYFAFIRVPEERRCPTCDEAVRRAIPTPVSDRGPNL